MLSVPILPVCYAAAIRSGSPDDFDDCVVKQAQADILNNYLSDPRKANFTRGKNDTMVWAEAWPPSSPPRVIRSPVQSPPSGILQKSAATRLICRKRAISEQKTPTNAGIASTGSSPSRFQLPSVLKQVSSVPPKKSSKKDIRQAVRRDSRHDTSDEESSLVAKSQQVKTRISVTKLNNLYKTYSRKITLKADQQQMQNISAKQQKKVREKVDKLQATLDTIKAIADSPCMFSSPQEISELMLQKTEVIRAVSPFQAKKVTSAMSSTAKASDSQHIKSYLDKYYSLKFLEKTAECETDKAILASARKLAADMGVSNDPKTKIWVKITACEDGYVINLRISLESLFKESLVHNTLNTIYECQSERSISRP